MPPHGSRIQICGRIAVELSGRDLTPVLRRRMERVLFAFLVVNRMRTVTRDEAIDALWPQSPPPHPDADLSVLLSRLRAALGADALAARGPLRLALPPGAWIDIEAAEEAIHRAQSAVAREDWAAAWGPSLAALFIGRRGFLPGEEGAWIEQRRGRLEEIYLSACEAYARAALGIGGSELPVGVKVARELVAAAPYRESAHALLMELLAARGDTAEALQVYEALRARLRDDLGIAPGPALRALQERLVRG